MKSKRSKASNNFSWIIVVALLIILYSSYFLLYIPKQEMLVKERGFRILEKYAENIHKKHNYYKTHIKNYGPFYALRPMHNNFPKAFENALEQKDSTKISNVITDLEKEIYAIVPKDEQQKFVVLNVDPGNFKLQGFKFKADFCKNIQPFYLSYSLLMSHLKFDKLFENIALLDSSGVIYNSNGSVVNDITNLKILLKDTLSKTQGGVMQKLEIQGSETHALILPFDFLNQKFYVAGFIAGKDYKKKTRAINSQLITIFSGLLLLVLIGMPILKIVFINRKERLNVRDAHYATISLILGCSVLVIFFIGIMKYYVVEKSKLTDRIVSISDDFTQKINDDFRHLDSLVNTILDDAFAESGELRDHLKSEDLYIKDEDIYRRKFPFNEIIFMNDEGIASKAITRTEFSNLVTLDLSERSYFKNLKEDSKASWPWKAISVNNVETFFLESIKSYNTGLQETAISFRLKEPVKTNKDSTEYLAITSHVPSLYNQIVPKDVAFVIVDASGDVLFHSNQSKNLQENFLVESNRDPKILSSIQYRTKGISRITYNERQWLARVVPLKDKPLYHITLIDLKYSDDKNARIYLFTFYLVLFTLVCVVAGMLIIKYTGTKKKFMKSKSWAFNWLIFDKKKHKQYKILLIAQLMLVLFQIPALVLLSKPFSVLLYQLAVITFSAFVAYSVLTRKKSNTTAIIILILLGILLVLLMMCSYRGFIGSVVLIILYNSLGKRIRNRSLKWDRLSGYNARYTYLAYMFIWLLGLSIVPTVNYYYSVKHQEMSLAAKDAMIYMANTSLLLRENHIDDHYATWSKNINKDAVDRLKIEYKGKDENKCNLKKSRLQTIATNLQIPGWIINYVDLYFSDKIPGILYQQLPCPLPNNDYLMPLTQSNNEYCEWTTETSLGDINTVLSYSAPYFNERVEITSENTIWKLFVNALRLVLLVAIPVVVLIFFILGLFKYLADLVLGTIVGKWKYPKSPEWGSIINQPALNKILLISFDASKYYDEINAKFSVKKFHAQALFDGDEVLNSKAKVIWISSLEECILNANTLNEILPKLQKLSKIDNKRIVLEMPCDMDFVHEYFEEYILEFQSDQAEQKNIFNSISGLKILFKDFYRFTGFLDSQKVQEGLKTFKPGKEIKFERAEDITLANAHLMKLQYSFIWQNLSKMEKMILFDLADDGMLNLKNRFLINRLKTKGLINVEPHPEIFTPSFQYFLKYSIDSDETLMLERKLGQQGKWKSTKYLLLLLLIPLVAFMFISQGTSIEKVVGILTGVLALFSGAVRLMDTSWLSGISKQ